MSWDPGIAEEIIEMTGFARVDLIPETPWKWKKWPRLWKPRQPAIKIRRRRGVLVGKYASKRRYRKWLEAVTNDLRVHHMLERLIIEARMR